MVSEVQPNVIMAGSLAAYSKHNDGEGTESCTPRSVGNRKKVTLGLA